MQNKPLNGLIVGLTRLSRDRFQVLHRTLATFGEAHAAQAAAALAYYVFFSIFPLLLVLIIAGSYFIDSQRIFMQVLWSVEQVIPASQELISENLRHVLEERGTVGIFVLITLLWAASGAFTSLAYNIDLAWPNSRRRNFLQKRLIGFRLIAGITGLLLLSVVLDWIAHVVPVLRMFDASSLSPLVVGVFSGFISWLTVFLMLLALYRSVPATRVMWNAALTGAFTASIGWKVATIAFAWYVKSGLGRYQLIYGSLGAIVALLFLIYLICFIILFGAHLTSAIDISTKEKMGYPAT